MATSVERNLISLIINFHLVRPSWFFKATLCRVIGWVKRHVYFTKAVFFILGLISSHSFVNNAVVVLWMDYLIELGRPLPQAAIAMNVQEGLYVICTFLIANIADAYTGPYKAIVFSTASYAFVGMEFWARWAHRALWHASLWHMHESHHRPRDGPFELNDVFAITNAVPAISLLSYGFFNKGLVPGLCFGAGLGITVFGIAYMFVHDGLVHKRFPVGPIADVPYFRKVAAAHKIHHSDKFNGVPYGLFLGPREIEEVGGLEELEREISRRTKPYKEL